MTWPALLAFALAVYAFCRAHPLAVLAIAAVVFMVGTVIAGCILSSRISREEEARRE